jgi:hypothetical protein
VQNKLGETPLHKVRTYYRWHRAYQWCYSLYQHTLFII